MRLGTHVVVTNTGRKRRRNEDSFVDSPPLFAVADGMGGAQAGEIASQITVDVLRDGDAEGTGTARVGELIQAANRRVYDRSTEDASVSGMGTTVTVALVEEGVVSFGHVGDSRGYLIRDGHLGQLTQDHSLVSELVRSGKISPEEAESHPQRSVITRALGTDPDVDVDTFAVDAEPGDVFLICSDGLTDMVRDATIEAIVAEHRRDLRTAAERLVEHAIRGGGDDNITVVVFELVDESRDGDTQTLAVAEDPPTKESALEEDTLTELDGVPVIAAPVEAMEPELEEPKGEGRLNRIVATVLLAVLAAGIVAIVVVALLWLG